MKRFVPGLVAIILVTHGLAPAVHAQQQQSPAPTAVQETSIERFAPLPIEDDVHRDVALEIIGTKECGPINLLDVWLTKDALTRYAVRKLAEGGRDGTMRAGIAYQMAGDHEGALAAYEKVLQEERNNLDVYNRLAVIAPKGMTVYAFGEAVPFTDVHPLIVNGRTMVPVRAVTEAIGAEVKWDPDTSTATFTVLGKAPVRITQGTNVARVGDLYVPLDVEPTVVPPGRFVVPLRFLSESFGYDVRWHSFTPGHAVISIREVGALMN